jgi:hypothetical protein
VAGLSEAILAAHYKVPTSPCGTSERVYRVAVRRLDFLLDTLLDFLLDIAEDGRLTLADRKPRVFAHASQRSTRNGLTALLLSSTYFEHRSTLSH